MAMRRHAWRFRRLGYNAKLNSGIGVSIVRADECRGRVCDSLSLLPFDGGVDRCLVPSRGVRAASSLDSERWCSPVMKSEVVKAKELLAGLAARRSMATMASEEAEGDGEALLVRYLERLKNYEKEGVPRGAGTDSADGFDLERMERLLVRLENPLSAYPVASQLLSAWIAQCLNPKL